MVIVPQKMEDCKPFASVLYLNTVFLALLTKCVSFFWIILKAKKHSRLRVLFGAGSRGRTDTVSLPLDFESSTSANSIIPAYDKWYYTIFKIKNQGLFKNS